MRKALLVFLFLLLATPALRAQGILDDSTQLVYGPHTTLYTTEESVLFADNEYRRVDTLLDGKQRWHFVGERNNRYQDLGNVGTAMQPIFFEAPAHIGASPGITVYEPYMRNDEDFLYYQTKSPYTKLFLGLGGGRRSVVDLHFARNVNPNWNVGFMYRSITADKQVGATGQLDRNVLSAQYNMFFRHMSKDSSYQAMGYWSRLGHEVFETGGIIFDPEVDEEDLLFDEDAPIWLRNSVSRELRQDYHLYHEYTRSKLVQVYHRFDKKKQKNGFENLTVDQNDAPYFNDRFLISTDSTVDAVTWREISNEVGLKGKFDEVFYNFYYKRRDLRFVYKYLPRVGPLTENYGGFRIGYRFSSKSVLRGRGEYLQGGKYLIHAEWDTKLYEISGKRMVHTPSFLSERYFGNHREWSRNYTALPQVDELKARLKLGGDRWSVQPLVSITNLSNPIFFDRDTLPTQIESTAQILTIGADARLGFGKFYAVPELRATTVSGDASRAVSIPGLFANMQLYYENILFEGNLQAQIGLDMHWKSDYNPYGYDPVTQQFYVQDSFEAPNYLVADVFANLRINKTILTVKMNNVLQGLQAPGYLVGGYYPGQPRILDIVVHWYFYD